ncbi:MoxR family ATPase [Actinomadura sp. NPDC047616]|uniref:AAA family ATPase n=1 Tax=Actinomadura sp. NPDC047616 TaxID=3155914 RepID=UPI0033D7C42F
MADELSMPPSPGDGTNPPGSPEGSPGASSTERPAWWIYRGTGRPLAEGELAAALPPPPPWRTFDGGPALPSPPADERDFVRRLGPTAGGRPRLADREEIDIVNTALLLRRPLLITGEPGVGKSSLAYRVARELGLGRVLRWPVSSRSTLREGLYEYDAIGRAQDAATARQLAGSGRGPHSGPEADDARRARPVRDGRADGDANGGDAAGATADTGLGNYLQLGALGTALLPYELPRVLLIDELDKSDIDLPNDLLDVFEEGEYRIPELVRVGAREPVVTVHTADPGGTAEIVRGHVRCRAFPLIFITSNGERDFPPAFLRRCLLYTMKEPDEARLADMVSAHFTDSSDERTRQLVRRFLEYRRSQGRLAADQLLNAAYLTSSGRHIPGDEWERVLDLVWQRLNPEAAAE